MNGEKIESNKTLYMLTFVVLHSIEVREREREQREF